MNALRSTDYRSAAEALAANDKFRSAAERCPIEWFNAKTGWERMQVADAMASASMGEDEYRQYRHAIGTALEALVIVNPAVKPLD